jgi:peptide/nickel transport system permease protein
VQNTLALMVPALLLSLLVAVPFGTLAAARKGSAIDAAVQAVSVVGVSLPAFWLGIMAMVVFGAKLRWLPAGGIQTPGLAPELFDVVTDRLRHSILPVGVLAAAYCGQWLRWVRSGVVDVLPQDFVRTARAKGLGPRAVLFRHALRNALLPFVTVLALAAPQLFAGALLTETVFAWPGVGRLQHEAILNNDSYVAVVVFLVSAALVLAANLGADLLCALLDPRVRRR